MKIIKTIFSVVCWVFVVTVGIFLTAFFINAFTDPKTDNTTAAISMLAILLLAFVFFLLLKLIKSLYKKRPAKIDGSDWNLKSQ